MHKNELEELIKEFKTFRSIAKHLGVSFSTVQYWSRKYELKSTFKKGEAHRCSKCGESDPSKFYGHKKSYCGKCSNEISIISGKRKRQLAVDTLGGKCVSCRFNKYACSLDIHHLDPSIKDEKFHRMRTWSDKKILEEIKSCVLLCKNCHSAHHAGLLQI